MACLQDTEPEAAQPAQFVISLPPRTTVPVPVPAGAGTYRFDRSRLSVPVSLFALQDDSESWIFIRFM